MSDLTNLIRREIGRQLANLVHPRHGVVTSYDPKTHSVKVTYQPDGNESGWIPIERHAAGQTLSFVHGPSPGDQVRVSFAEGDMESGTVTGFLHSDQDPAPQVQSGETMLSHTKTGTTIHVDKDGHITITTKKKNVTINTNGGDLTYNTAGGNVTHTTDGNYTLTVKGHFGVKVGSISVDKG